MTAPNPTPIRKILFEGGVPESADSAEPMSLEKADELFPCASARSDMTNLKPSP